MNSWVSTYVKKLFEYNIKALVMMSRGIINEIQLMEKSEEKEKENYLTFWRQKRTEKIKIMDYADSGSGIVTTILVEIPGNISIG